MPEFEVVTLREAMMSSTTTGKRSQIEQEYAGTRATFRRSTAWAATVSVRWASPPFSDTPT